MTRLDEKHIIKRNVFPKIQYNVIKVIKDRFEINTLNDLKVL